MENDPDVAPDEVTDAAPAEETAQTADAPPADESAQGVEPNPPEEAKPQKTPWYNRRIAEEAERRRRAEQELAQIRARYEQGEPPAPEAQPDIDRLVEMRARQLAEQQALQQRAQNVYQAGKQEYQDYDQAVSTLSSAMGDAVQRPEFLETVFDLPNGHAVIHHLGTDLDAANEILSLPPLKMARKLEKLAETLSSTSKPSPRAATPAPEPIRPVGASTTPGKDQSKWGPAEWDKYYRERRQSR